MSERDELERGPEDARIAALYRESAREEPPSHLDHAVREMARDATRRAGAPQRQAWWRPWRVPFAAAALVVISASVVTLVVEREEQGLHYAPAPAEGQGAAPPERQDVAPPERQDVAPVAPPEIAPAQQARPAAPAPARSPESTRQATRDDPGRRTENEEPRRERAEPKLAKQAAPDAPADARDAAGPAAVASAPPPVAASSGEAYALRDRASAAPEGRAQQEMAEAKSAAAPAAAKPAPAPAVVKPAPAPPPAKPEIAMLPRPEAKAAPSAPAPASRGLGARRSDAIDPRIAEWVTELEGKPPKQWLERIAALRTQGEARQADALIEEFRRRFPNEPIPEAARTP